MTISTARSMTYYWRLAQAYRALVTALFALAKPHHFRDATKKMVDC